MIPVLLELGPFKIYSYGLMLGIAFLLGSYILALEVRRKKLDHTAGKQSTLASTVTVLAVIFGIAGAKLLFLIEEWSAFREHPVRMAFSAGGLTWYGGFILGLLAVYIYVHSKKVPFLRFLDALGVALIIAYGVGRLGCHFSGDGDYGYPTTLPWGTIYAQGINKPSMALEGYFEQNPEQRAAWHYDSLRVIPAGMDRLGNRISRFDEVTPLHPAPVYELGMGIVGFAFLWGIRKKPFPDGKLFMIYLMLSGAFRFLIEFIRLNPRIIAGLTEAQAISVLLFVIGLVGMLYLDRRKPQAT